MRDEGEGIPRMFEEMEESFLGEPEIDVVEGTFMVRLFNEPIFIGPSAAWKKLVDDLPISPTQKRVLLAHPEGFTNEDYRRLNRVDRDEAYRQIHELVVAGILQAAEAPGRGAVYRVAPDLHGARAFLEARVPKLRDHFRQHERLQNANYRELFGVTRYTAVREWRRLVDEGFLRIEGERRGAHYLPQPALGLAVE
jgi:predicted HTH transcriptional regulator